MSIKVPRSADVVLVDHQVTALASMVVSTPVLRYVARDSMEKKKRGDQLRAVAAVPAIQKTWCSCNYPYSSDLDARKLEPKTPGAGCESVL